MLITHSEAESLVAHVDQLPVGGTSPIADAAKKLGIGFITLFFFLIAHPDVWAVIKADIAAHDFLKAETDLVAAYQAANP